MEPLRLGFVGAGVMANFAVYPALHFAPIRLAAVCDLDSERARHAAEKFGAPCWYTDYRRMWEKEDLEAVVVQMHPRPRQPIVREALEAGLHVFAPKPPAPSLEAALELSEASRRTGKTLMINFERRFSYGAIQARAMMAEPSFGGLRQLLGSFCSGAYDEARARGYDGPVHAYVVDFAVHHLDLARYLGGEVRKLSLFHTEREGRVAISVALAFESGAVGVLQLNSERIWWRNYDRIELTGCGEYVVLDGLWGVRRYTEAHNSFTENYSDQRSGELTGDGTALVEFVRAIRENREPIASIHDSVGTMRLCQAVYGAVRDGREGTIPI
ncbi:MAG TPA: Gfo/Idh/MocA family oxidoreductase [Vicinamibacteria bacterium]|nr:Gfo/Idh/MocA family oxidoreductase [Vicinamibacteria bacterium]